MCTWAVSCSTSTLSHKGITRMALLTPQEIEAIRHDFWKECSGAREGCDLDKPAGLELFRAIDQFYETNRAAMNQAIPATARTILSARQKLRAFRDVARAKWGKA